MATVSADTVTGFRISNETRIDRKIRISKMDIGILETGCWLPKVSFSIKTAVFFAGGREDPRSADSL